MQPSRVKVLEFITNLAIGGTERQVINLGLSLDPVRFESHFACLKRWGELIKEIEKRGKPLVEYSIRSLYDYKTVIKQVKFAQYIKRNQIHIVHTYGFYTNIFAIPAARLAGAPVVVASIRDTGGYLTRTQFVVQKLLCRLSDCIVVNAEAIRQWLIVEGYDPDKVTVIRNGIDVSRFTPNTRGSRPRQQLGLPKRTPVIAVLARLVPFNRLQYFLEAAALVASRVREARFLVIGDTQLGDDGTEYRQELERCADRLGLSQRLVFTGFRLDVPELLSEVTVSVLPCVSSEGLSNTLLESMAAGVPVVATTVGGNPEVVQDGRTGLLVPPRDPHALANAISRLLEDPGLARRFGRAGRDRVAEHFSIEQMVSKTERLYLGLLERKQSQAIGACSRAVSCNTIEE